LPNRAILSESYVTQGEIVVNLAQLATQIHPVAQDWPKDPDVRVGLVVYAMAHPPEGAAQLSRRCDNAADFMPWWPKLALVA
jgi:hypothetical protein